MTQDVELDSFGEIREPKTAEEIDKILNPLEDKGEDWPEFEIIKDDVTDFFQDLPIELYEDLFRPCHLEKGRLIQYLLDFPKE